MRRLICTLMHHSTAYAGGKTATCRTCGRTWTAPHHVEGRQYVEPPSHIDIIMAELDKIEARAR